MWARVGSVAALIALHTTIYFTSGLYSLLACLIMCACFAAIKHARDSRESIVRNVGMWSSAVAAIIVLSTWIVYDWRKEKTSSAVFLMPLAMAFTGTLMGHRFALFGLTERIEDTLPDGKRV
ncbi:MAG: hypothetical protein ABIV13_03535 [Fimbriimonadales bacterium]